MVTVDGEGEWYRGFARSRSLYNANAAEIIAPRMKQAVVMLAIARFTRRDQRHDQDDLQHVCSAVIRSETSGRTSASSIGRVQKQDVGVPIPSKRIANTEIAGR